MYCVVVAVVVVVVVAGSHKFGRHNYNYFRTLN